MMANRHNGLQLEPSHGSNHIEPRLALNTERLKSD